jgi:Na+-transporting NADH:ubiquinone oxidoreductase subunit A
MAERIKIKKGLHIPLMGQPEETLLGGSLLKSEFVSICPEDYQGITPKLAVKPGDVVKAGEPLFYDKKHTEMLFASPVSGEVTAIDRGAKRRILNITVKADEQTQYVDFGKKNVDSLSSEEVKASIIEAGIWWTIRQRPFDIVAEPNKEPRDIFVTGFDSAPLAPSYNYILAGQEDDLAAGFSALTKLTRGKVYLGISPETTHEGLRNAKNVVITEFEGPHPAGNVGVQINKLKPVNNGETVWTLSALDVVIIGRLFNKGIVDLTRFVAFTGSEVQRTGYCKMLIGSQLAPVLKNNTNEGAELRFISGNPLTGRQVSENGVLRAYDSQVTVIPDGEDVHEFMGWASFSPKRYSAGNLYFRWKKEYKMDARVLGGPRGIICSNEYDKVFPMDIYPEQLIKAIIAFNIDKMEELGIYEVAPEDFALCEFVDTSKTELQKIVRTGLDLLRKEME